MHNYHFGVWACMFDGQSAKAMELTDAMDKQLQVVESRTNLILTLQYSGSGY